MKKVDLVKVLVVIVGLLILSKNWYYRKWLGYENIPETVIFDERDYPFIGYTFRKTGVPTGWSNMNVYKIFADTKEHKDLGFDGLSMTADGEKPSIYNSDKFNYPTYWTTDVNIGKGTETIRLYQPFLDHPIFGSWLYSLGITNNPQKFDDLKPEEYRRVALALSVLTGILIFAASWGLYRNLIVALIAMVIYSTVPGFVIMSRFALLENVLIPLSLLLIFILSFIKKGEKNWWLLAMGGIVSSLAFLTKEQGIYVLIIGIIMLCKKVRIKESLFFFLPFLGLTMIYYGYVYYLAPDLIIKLLFDQTSRGFFGPLAYLHSVAGPKFTQFPVEGYWLWGLLSLVGLAQSDFKKHRVIILGYLSYLFIFMMAGSGNYPWYNIPFLPFLIMAASVFTWELITKPNIFKLFIFLGLPFASSLYWGYFVFKSDNLINVYRLIIMIFLGAWGMTKLNPKMFKNMVIQNIIRKKILWIIFVVLVGYQMNKWNWQSFLYITANWNRLPVTFEINNPKE